MTSLREKNLLKKIKKGDEKSFAKVYDLYVDKIYRFVFLKTSSREKTEEIVQDVFLKFWNFTQREKQKIKNIQSLLYQISRNLVIDYYRSKEYSQINYSLEDKQLSNKLSAEIEQSDNDINVKIDIKYDIEKVKEALKLLPENYKDIIILKFVNDLSNKEIARILNKKEGNIRVLAHRALKELRNKITQ